jgi:predicted nucleotidyltransferase
MRNFQIHSQTIEKIAKALGELNKEVAFVGGSVVGIYADDLAADDVRPTKDIDITLQIASLSKLEILRAELTNKGFKQQMDEDVICRFVYDDTLVDVMATQAIGWAPANQWFAPGFEHLISVEIGQTTIRLLSLPYFLATKFDAHTGRGASDPRTSKDFEDITYLLDYVSDLEEQILAAPNDVKTYLIEQFNAILTDSAKQEAILAQLPYSIQMERFAIIMDKLHTIQAAASQSF